MKINFIKIMSIINDECKINGVIGPISIDKTEKILEQMKNSICQIEGKELGTGFFCKIKYNENNISVLITNSNILDEEFIKLNKNVNLLINNDKVILNIDNNDILYFSQINNHNIIIIKIKEDIKINNYLELDESLFINDYKKIYEQKPLYILNYNEEQKPSVYYALNLSHLENNDKIIYKSYNNLSSLGGPILDLSTNKIIGIYKGININNEYHIGTLFREPLNELYNLNNNINKEIKSKEIKEDKEIINNEIKIELKVDKEDINKNIYFLDNTLFGSYLSELNESNTELFINENKSIFKKYFIPEKEGIYKVKLILNKSINDCSHIFSGCKNLINIDLSSFSTKNITNMSYMFYDCINLENINISNFDTKNVTNMESMFENCINLKSLDLSVFNTTNVTNMMYMFSGCTNLIDINISSFDFKNEINTDLMFFECLNLNQMKINKEFYDKIANILKNLNVEIIKV